VKEEEEEGSKEGRGGRRLFFGLFLSHTCEGRLGFLQLV